MSEFDKIIRFNYGKSLTPVIVALAAVLTLIVIAIVATSGRSTSVEYDFKCADVPEGGVICTRNHLLTGTN